MPEPMIIDGLKPGTIDFFCACGRNLGKSLLNGEARIIQCGCGRTMSLTETQFRCKPRESFVMSAN